MLGVKGISEGNLAVLDKITGRDRRLASCFFRPAVGILVAAGVLLCLQQVYTVCRREGHLSEVGVLSCCDPQIRSPGRRLGFGSASTLNTAS